MYFFSVKLIKYTNVFIISLYSTFKHIFMLCYFKTATQNPFIYLINLDYTYKYTTYLYNLTRIIYIKLLDYSNHKQ
jgi:hypothetical protein